MYRVACCAILVENETQQVFTSPACWKRPVAKHEAVQVNTFPLKQEVHRPKNWCKNQNLRPPKIKVNRRSIILGVANCCQTINESHHPTVSPLAASYVKQSVLRFCCSFFAIEREEENPTTQMWSM